MNNRDYRYLAYKNQELQRKCNFMIKVAIVGVIIGLIAIIVMIRFAENTDYEVDTYLVKSGDTLWEIAEQYSPDDMNYHEYIDKIMEDNDLDDSIIYLGQRLKIRIYEN